MQAGEPVGLAFVVLPVGTPGELYCTLSAPHLPVLWCSTLFTVVFVYLCCTSLVGVPVLCFTCQSNY